MPHSAARYHKRSIRKSILQATLHAAPRSFTAWRGESVARGAAVEHETARRHFKPTRDLLFSLRGASNVATAAGADRVAQLLVCRGLGGRCGGVARARDALC